jgi:hypothetical protein
VTGKVELGSSGKERGDREGVRRRYPVRRLVLAVAGLTVAIAGCGGSMSEPPRTQAGAQSSLSPSASASSGTVHQLNGSADNLLTGISCTAPHNCVVVDDHGATYMFNGTSWSNGPTISSGLSAVSCVTTQWCVAIGESDAYVYSNGQWGAGVPAPGQDSLEAISCASQTFCMIVNSHGSATVFDGLSWGEAIQAEPANETTPTFQAVSCPNTSLCVALDSEGQAVEYQNGSWETPMRVAPGQEYNSEPSFDYTGAISCASPTFCRAVDKNGDVYAYDGAMWTGAQRIDPHQLNAISCPVVGWCMASDGNGNENTSFVGDTLMLRGGSWSSPSEQDSNGQILDVSCVSVNFCVGIDPSAAVQLAS